jgi:hypothetical protein
MLGVELTNIMGQQMTERVGKDKPEEWESVSPVHVASLPG